MKVRHRRTFREVERIASRYGYRFERLTAKGHLRWTSPGRPFVVTLSAQSDQQALLNVEETFRKVARR
jgi:hypothetical protein